MGTIPLTPKEARLLFALSPTVNVQPADPAHSLAACGSSCHVIRVIDTEHLFSLENTPSATHSVGFMSRAVLDSRLSWSTKNHTILTTNGAFLLSIVSPQESFNSIHLNTFEGAAHWTLPPPL